MKFVCKELRLSDTWFQTSFVAVFLCVINAVFFLWSDANFHSNLLIVLLIDAFLLTFVFSNKRVWVTPENCVRLTSTIFGIIPWRSQSIPHAKLLHVTAKRVADDDSWPNCTADLSWTDHDRQGMIVTKSTTILQRRQELGISVAEAKQVAKNIGVKFIDSTHQKAAPARRSSDVFEPEF